MTALTFTIHPAEEGGFWAEAAELPITTQGDDLDELSQMINDAVDGYFFEDPAARPRTILWRFEAAERTA